MGSRETSRSIARYLRAKAADNAQDFESRATSAGSCSPAAHFSLQLLFRWKHRTKQTDTPGRLQFGEWSFDCTLKYFLLSFLFFPCFQARKLPYTCPDHRT